MSFKFLESSSYSIDSSSNDLFNPSVDRFIFRGNGFLAAATLSAMPFVDGSSFATWGNDPANSTENFIKETTRLTSDWHRQQSMIFVDKMLNFFNNDVLVNIGAYTNRLEAAARNSEVKVENQMAAQARITNTDYATASVEAVRQNILQQSTISLMNQAKISHRSVINLIQQSGQVL